MNVSIILGSILVGIIVVVFVLALISYFSKSEWFCNVFGWHNAPARVGFDGVSLNGTCPRCGRHVLQDSQGNWF